MSDQRKCFLVRVKTTNGMEDATKGADGEYLRCTRGIIYVHTCSFADVQLVIDPDWVESIEFIGESVCT